MALSLSAEQKNLRALFINDDRYVVPSFQRPYRWTKKEAKQLFDDITQAYNADEDYFVGNIVIARGNEDKARPQIVDGQQRILTLWMFLKALTILTNVSRLEEMLSIRDWEDNSVLSKIDSLVFEEADQIGIDNLLNWNVDDFNKGIKEISKLGLIQYNAIQIYRWLQEFLNRISESEKTKFWKYFIDRIYLLPIVLDGKDISEATSRALTIFETINNRGLDLADADILKAKLYEMACAGNEGNKFISQWKDLGQKCLELNASVNDVFRYYLRILRAKNNQTTSEPNLRNFFLNNSVSPFKTRNWQYIMDDLVLIVDVLERIDSLQYTSNKTALLYQVLKVHSSAIPFSAMVAFVYSIKGQDDLQQENEILHFLELLIKICYSHDPAQDIKYVIFDLNVRIMNNKAIQLKPINVSDDFFNERRRLRSGFVMLYHYLKENDWTKNKLSGSLNIERIAKQNDMPSHIDWPTNTLSDDLESMANFSIIDFPKTYKSLLERSSSFNSSSLSSVACILGGKNYYSYADFLSRKEDMQATISAFLSSNCQIDCE
ncbi:DUF262 domain-containing protein [Bacteroides sp. AN502(2024)]|uniref:DUF262 domain-containing protein n=1 Tax=Bacteroides sp. AN502(2024) TaxID=3160599 RepID=UPI0035152E53